RFQAGAHYAGDVGVPRRLPSREMEESDARRGEEMTTVKRVKGAAVERSGLVEEAEVQEVASQLEGKDAEAVRRWGVDRFHPHIALATSLQAEDMVILDMAWRINPAIRVFTLDTGRLHEETYQVMERIRDRYGVAVESYFPDRQAVAALAAEERL